MICHEVCEPSPVKANWLRGCWKGINPSPDDNEEVETKIKNHDVTPYFTIGTKPKPTAIPLPGTCVPAFV